MDANIIDKLVVTLGLDSKQFGSEAQAAASRLDKFNQTIKKLNIDETKLNDQQKKHIQALRDIAVQGERTGKELSAVGAIGKEMWGVLEKGAASFGAALGLYGLGDLARDAIHANNQIKNLAGTMGMLPAEVDAFKQAVANASGGTGEGALGSLRALSGELQAQNAGGIPSQQLLMAAALSARYNGGQAVSLQNPDHTFVGTEEAALRFADPIKNMGLALASRIFAGIFDDETLLFLSKGRKADEEELAKARASVPSAKNFDEAHQAAVALTQLANASNNLKDIFVLMSSPTLTAGIRMLTAYVQYARGEIKNKEELREKIDEINGDYRGKAQAIVGGMQGTNFFTEWSSDTADTPHWTYDQRVARAQELLAQGVDANQIPARIEADEAAGRPPGAQGGPTAIGPISTLADAVEKEESGGNPSAVSPKGARGLMQIMPDTFADIRSRHPDLGPNIDDPATNRKAGEYYLQELFDKYHDEAKTVAAYNWGPANLDQDIAAHGEMGWQQFLPRETAAYLPRVLGDLGQGGDAASTETNVNINSISINVPSGDPKAIAQGLRSSVDSAWHATTAQTNSGPR